MFRLGAPGEIRTPGLLLRRQPLYPAELRAHGVYSSLHVRGIRGQWSASGHRHPMKQASKSRFSSGAKARDLGDLERLG